jgi:acetyl esterase/lipase
VIQLSYLWSIVCRVLRSLLLLHLFPAGIRYVSESHLQLPSKPIYLWPEKPLVVPDREHIKDQRVVAVDNPSLVPFWPEPELANGAAVIIFPGGGFTRLAINHEGYDIARWFSGRGVAAFVVKYRLQEYGFPASLLDGLRAMRVLRKHAEEWNINPDKIGVTGFSAGGHLAASLITRSDFALDEEDLLSDIRAIPDFAILGYPVITMVGAETHAGSRTALLGENPDPALLYDNSLQFHVKAEVPPVFMFHGVGDQAVSVGNSLEFFNEVQKYNRESELHIYQSSVHGVGMIQGQGSISAWPKALELWLKHNQLI